MSKVNWGAFDKIDLTLVAWGYSSKREVKAEIRELEMFDVLKGTLQAVKLTRTPVNEHDISCIDFSEGKK